MRLCPLLLCVVYDLHRKPGAHGRSLAGVSLLSPVDEDREAARLTRQSVPPLQAVKHVQRYHAARLDLDRIENASLLDGQIDLVAGESFEVSPDRMVFRDGRVFPEERPDRGWRLGALIPHIQHKLERYSKTVIGTGSYDSQTDPLDFKTGKGNISPVYSFGTDIVELEVDRETGKITVLNVFGAHDIGKALNPIEKKTQKAGQ